MQPSEISSLLTFYLRSETITSSDCDQGGIAQLLNKAETNVPDSALFDLNIITSSTCDVCPDGALCGETNAKGQTCTCKDVDSDGISEYCYLKPIIAPISTCEICPDGTLCNEKNAKDQTCKCKDVNSDGKWNTAF